jgi:hypothetical protein
MAESLTDILRKSAANPASISVDGQTVTEHSLSELIALDCHLRAIDAAENDATAGIRFATFIPPGPLGGAR